MTSSTTFTSADGDGYELQMGRWSRRLAPLFIAFSDIQGGGQVLDVGCGTGNLTLALARNPRFETLHAIDLCDAYIDFARRRTSDPRVHFKSGDACALPYPDGQFDHAMTSLVVQFVPQPERAVREMRRVTRRGGAVAATTWDTETLALHRIIFESAAQVDPAARQIRADHCARPMSRAEGLRNAWQACGFSDIVQDRITISMDFASFDDFWAPVEGRDGPYAQYFRTLSATLKPQVRERVRASYLDGAPDGPRSYPAHAWAIRGIVP